MLSQKILKTNILFFRGDFIVPSMNEAFPTHAKKKEDKVNRNVQYINV